VGGEGEEKENTPRLELPLSSELSREAGSTVGALTHAQEKEGKEERDETKNTILNDMTSGGVHGRSKLIPCRSARKRERGKTGGRAELLSSGAKCIFR